MTEQQQPGKGIEPAYSTALPAPQGGALPTGLEWQALERMANVLADSDVIPYRLKRKPADVAVILLAAREYGIPPLMALSKLPVVNGTPAPMGELMVALILRAGHSIRADFKNPDGTRYKGGPITPQHYGEAVVRRRDWADGVEESLTFTIEEALNAGLIDSITDGKVRARVVKTKSGQQVEEVTPWEQYTPNMARWRAVANVGRLYFPDVLLGLSYLPEELGAMVDAEGAPIVGEVVDQPEQPRRRTANGASIEQRSAQEAADRLAEFVGPLDVLDNVLAHAEENGYAGEQVTYLGNAMTLRGAIAARKADLRDNTVTHDGPTEEAQAAEEPQKPAEEAPTPPPATEEPQDPAPAPQAAAEEPAGMPVTELARAALEERDADTLRALWNMAKDAGQLDDDVIAVVGDDDLAALDLNGTTRLPLRGLLIAVNGYVGRHGAAVRDLGEPMGDTPTTGDTPDADPWATDPQ